MEKRSRIETLGYLEDLCAEISNVLGITTFTIYGGTIAEALVNHRLSKNDVDVAIKGKSKKIILKCIFSLIKNQFEITYPYLEYTIYKNEKVIIVKARKKELFLDLTFMHDPDKVGLFDGETVYYDWPKKKFIDKYNTVLAIKNKSFKFIRAPGSENPYLVSSRFIRLCSKYNASLLAKEHKPIIKRIGEEFSKMSRHSNNPAQQLSLVSAVLTSIIRAKKKKLFIAEMVESQILKNCLPKIHHALVMLHADSTKIEKIKKIQSKTNIVHVLMACLKNKKARLALAECIKGLAQRDWSLEDIAAGYYALAIIESKPNKLLDKKRKRKKKVFMRGGSLSQIYAIGNIVIKSYTGPYRRGYEKLKKEVNYLQNLPSNLKKNFPHVIDYADNGDSFCYAMPYYKDYKTLAEISLDKDVPIEEVWSSLERVITFLRKKMFCSKHLEVEKDFIVIKEFNRVNSALQVLSQMKEYSRLTNLESIMLNKENLISPVRILSDLKFVKKVRRLLSERQLVLHHGNFHLANILVKKDKFILIDPRGELFGTREYDYSKMLAHLLMHYDEIFFDKFCLKERGGSFLFSLTDPLSKKRTEYLKEKYIKYIKENFNFSQSWFKKLSILAAFHTISLTSYHARRENTPPERVKAYYLSGLKLLNAAYKGKINFIKQLFEIEDSGI